MFIAIIFLKYKFVGYQITVKIKIPPSFIRIEITQNSPHASPKEEDKRQWKIEAN